MTQKKQNKELFEREKKDRKVHGRENKAEEFGKEWVAKDNDANAGKEPTTLHANLKN